MRKNLEIGTEGIKLIKKARGNPSVPFSFHPDPSLI
jgi:hypothetical protein